MGRHDGPRSCPPTQSWKQWVGPSIAGLEAAAVKTRRMAALLHAFDDENIFLEDHASIEPRSWRAEPSSVSGRGIVKMHMFAGAFHRLRVPARSQRYGRAARPAGRWDRRSDIRRPRSIVSSRPAKSGNTAPSSPRQLAVDQRALARKFARLIRYYSGPPAANSCSGPGAPTAGDSFRSNFRPRASSWS